MELQSIDFHLAGFLCSLEENPSEALKLCASFVSALAREGHVCLELRQLKNYTDALEEEAAGEIEQKLNIEIKKVVENLSPESLKGLRTVGSPDEFKPLVLDAKDRLYLYKFFCHQKKLAAKLHHYSESTGRDMNKIPVLAEQLFQSAEKESDSQRLAALNALQSKMSIISGGPGTGKTTTVVKILALLISEFPGEINNVALAAPTGKAASRLMESVRNSKQKLPIADVIKARIPDEAYTIHRLLKMNYESREFRYNEKNPLPYDLIVVDEASMIDMMLLSELFQALKKTCRIILLGDKDQLASVEAGSVMSDLCSLTEGNVSHCVTRLNKSYRFTDDSPIFKFSKAVNEGNSAVVNSMEEFIELDANNSLRAQLEPFVNEGYADYIAAEDIEEKFSKLEKFRILCALREGPYGFGRINLLVENILKETGYLKTVGEWYENMPVMVTQNDYNLGLFNGDIGIVLKDGNSLKAFFPAADSAYIKIPRNIIPGYEKVYAMTVHKSQGSEFDEVLLLLPDKDNPVLTRELLYTAVTRAKNKVRVLGKNDILAKAVERRIQRNSGLLDELGYLAARAYS